VKITRAEPGGLGGQGLWRPAALGLRPGYESEAMKRYVKGEYGGDGGGAPHGPGTDKEGSKV
jgi:hypothetical protein